ncbi:phage terminase small subunit [Gammaproteobacteria bacterium AS21]
MNLARKHFQKTMAAKQSLEKPTDHIRPNANQHELMMAQLHNHSRALKKTQSLVAKATIKASYIADYQAYIDGVISADSGNKDDVVTTIMLWCIDAGNYAYALQIAAYALKHDLPMPDKFGRNTACIIAEEIASAALKAPEDDKISLDVLSTAWELLEGADYHDQAKAKLLKALGNANKDANHPESAIEFYKEALLLNDRIGVKKELTALEKQVKDSIEPTTPDSEATTS